MKKRKQTYSAKEENAFSSSTGDLMAGLLFIFILLLMGALLQVREKEEMDEEVVQEYNKVKQQLYIDLQAEFKDDLKTWDAVIDSSLTVRFQEPSMLFDNNSYVLKHKFREILDDFFPRYIKVLNKPQYRDNIEEIRIEGHTDNNASYFYNMELSQNRTRAVLEYCFTTMNAQQQKWAERLITANGLSYSQPIYDKQGEVDKARSRRVEFRVRTNAEKHLETIVNQREKKKNE